MSSVWSRHLKDAGSPGSPRAIADVSDGPTGVIGSLTNSPMKNSINERVADVQRVLAGRSGAYRLWVGTLRAGWCG